MGAESAHADLILGVKLQASQLHSGLVRVGDILHKFARLVSDWVVLYRVTGQGAVAQPFVGLVPRDPQGRGTGGRSGDVKGRARRRAK